MEPRGHHPLLHGLDLETSEGFGGRGGRLRSVTPKAGGMCLGRMEQSFALFQAVRSLSGGIPKCCGVQELASRGFWRLLLPHPIYIASPELPAHSSPMCALSDLSSCVCWRGVLVCIDSGVY